MTFGYWFWLGVGGVIGALALLALTGKGKKRPRTMRTIHAVALFALLAFGGFRCAREEHTRTTLLNESPGVYTLARTRSDGGGIKFLEDGKRVEAVEYRYRLGGRDYAGLGRLADAYTVERDFFPDDLVNRCLLIRIPTKRPDISRLEAVLTSCPTPRENGWQSPPENVLQAVDSLWRRER